MERNECEGEVQVSEVDETSWEGCFLGLRGNWGWAPVVSPDNPWCAGTLETC